ncbi:uncharacterized protein [Paramisgurnus dabryanus]|uniref:uncharacterized protein isoform X1 n=1 Tax=Paramisgurnus dabryanus TaxID=90735 RepID=UPI0031F47599
MNTLLWILLSHCFILINADCNNNFIGAGKASKKAVVGENVILPCYNVIKQTNCTNTTWLSVEKGVIVELVQLGKINLKYSERGKRVSLTSNCSLHISNIKAEDCGCYTCQQWKNTNEEVAKNDRLCLSVTKGPTTTAKIGPTTTAKIETTATEKSDSKIVIPSVLVITALLVTTLTVWLIYRRRAHKRASVVNQNNVSTEHNGEDVTYIELKHNTVKQSKGDTVTEDQEIVYSGVKFA